MRDRFGIFGSVIRIRKLSLFLVMMLRIPNNVKHVVLDRFFHSNLRLSGTDQHLIQDHIKVAGLGRLILGLGSPRFCATDTNLRCTLLFL